MNGAVLHRSIIIMIMQNKKKLYLTISILSFLVVLVALTAIGVMFFSFKQSREAYDQLAMQAKMGTVSSVQNFFWNRGSKDVPDPVEIPIDFNFLREENEDIIGWIQVEGTTIDYPILYDTTYNMYYLNHNYKGTYTGYGSIFMLEDNASDFTDFNTVVYGHNMLDGSMFAQLHQFRKKDFFDSHGQILVYTPDRKMTYQVFASYRTDNLNIVVNNDFSTEELRTEYIGRIYEHNAVANFNQDYSVTADDRILTLSTCIGNPAYRYVVQGILVSDEPGICITTQSTEEGK